jgi:PhoPQ-activated pathogenicity-related protein
MWVAEAATRDFRKSTWSEKPAATSGTAVAATMDPPISGYRAFFAELDYALDGLTYHLCTQVRVVGPAK